MRNISNEELEEILFDKTRQLFEKKLGLSPLEFRPDPDHITYRILEYKGKILFTFNYSNYRVECASDEGDHPISTTDILYKDSTECAILERAEALQKEHPDWAIFGLYSYGDTIMIGTPLYWFAFTNDTYSKRWSLCIMEDLISVYRNGTDECLYSTIVLSPDDLIIEMTRLVLEFVESGG